MNKKTLVSLSTLSERKRREIQEKGREVYKQQCERARTFKEAFKVLLKLKPLKAKDITKLQNMGMETRNLSLLVASFFDGLVGEKKINVEAFKLCLKLLGENNESSDLGASFNKLVEAIHHVRTSDE